MTDNLNSCGPMHIFHTVAQLSEMVLAQKILINIHGAFVNKLNYCIFQMLLPDQAKFKCQKLEKLLESVNWPFLPG